MRQPSRRLLPLIFLSMLAATSMMAQESTKGRDFWFTYLYNIHETNPSWNPGEHTVNVLGSGDCTVRITEGGGRDSVSLQLNGRNNRALLHRLGNNRNMPVATPYDGGYHLVSDKEVWVYACNHINESQDVAMVLPTVMLASEYVVQDYPAHQFGAQVAFVATEDNTTLTMTVPCNIQGTSITAGTTLTPTLMKGQAYLLVSDGDGSSFSGMRVSSNRKPFAMFHGGRSVVVPIGASGKDMLYEQAVPQRYWGRDFVVPGARGQSGDNLVRVTSAEDGCVVKANGAVRATLVRGQSTSLSFNASAALHITTTKPASVVLYLSSRASAGIGDPSSVTIFPTGSGVTEGRFQLSNSFTIPISCHYLNVVCDTSWVHQLQFDETFVDVMSSPRRSYLDRYCIINIPITYKAFDHGVHQVSNSAGPFYAYVYGLGEGESYAFPLGFTARVIPIVRDTVSLADEVCQGQTYHRYGFNLTSEDTQEPGTRIFADSSQVDSLMHYSLLSLTILPTSVTDIHLEGVRGERIPFGDTVLTQEGTYTFRFTATNGCDSIVNVTLTLHAPQISLRDTVVFSDTLCQGTGYSLHGFNISPEQTRNVLSMVVVDSVIEDTVAHYRILKLTLRPSPSQTVQRMIVEGDTVQLFDTVFAQPGVYTFHYTAANGCDSSITLILDFQEVSILASATEGCPGETFTLTARGVHMPQWYSYPPDPKISTQQAQRIIHVRPRSTTTYSLLGNAGQVLASITLNVAPPPDIYVRKGCDFYDFDHPVVVLDDYSDGSDLSTWMFGDGTVYTGAHVRHEVLQPLPDTLAVTLLTCNAYHCCADTTLFLPLEIRSVWFPNVFTPDGEDNRTFGCHTNCEVESYHLWLYNRWGLLVWESDNVGERWDGTHHGTPVMQDAYAFHWEMTDRRKVRRSGTGTVVLLR